MLNVLADPDIFFGLPGCQIIKDQRKIKVGRIEFAIKGQATTVYLKRYNAFSWRYRLGSLFRSSGASRALKGAAMLARAGVGTPRPLAAVESRSCGMLTKSFFLSEEIEGGKTADSYWRERLSACPGSAGVHRRRRFLIRLGRLFALLHRKRVYHNDLKDANIIVSETDHEDGNFFLLDLEGIRVFRHLTTRRRVKNLVQLHRTFGGNLSATQKLYLLKSYLGDDFLDDDKRKDWVDRILRASRRGDLRSLRKMRRTA
jgi:tRNA A-37 threonylcarbamoyl transferase component Bud32